MFNKKILLLSSVLLCSACSSNTKNPSSDNNQRHHSISSLDTNKETSVSNSNATSASQKESSSDKKNPLNNQNIRIKRNESVTSTSGNSSHNKNENQVSEEFPYAVTLDTLTSQSGNTQSHFYNFSTELEHTAQNIAINLQDLTTTGKGIYIKFGPQDIFYPITIENIPTKEISVIDSKGQSRRIMVNTQITLQTTNEENSLNISGDTYYLFHNKQGSISLATRHFNDNPGGTQLNEQALVEYILNNSIVTTSPNAHLSQEQQEVVDYYYKIIHSTKLEQQRYIDSIKDESQQQMVQSAISAAISQATALQVENPEDAELIETALQQLLNEE